MASSQAKENILNKIRQALSNPVPLPFPESEGNQAIYPESTEDPLVVFAEEFTRLQGNFAYCTDEENLKTQLIQLITEKKWTNIFFREPKIRDLLDSRIVSYNDLAGCDVSVTGCEFLVARTGTIVLSAAQYEGRTTSVYAPVHICIACTAQLVYDIKDAIAELQTKFKGTIPSFITFASGPSRTADIEKTLVTGVHGPKEVYCFIVENLTS